MRKHIKLIVFSISLFIIFLTYISFSGTHSKINYIALGDSVAAGRNPYGVDDYGYTDYISDYLDDENKLGFYTKAFARSGYTTDDVVNEIENNKSVEIDGRTVYIKEALRESDLVTISIGANNFIRGVSLDTVADKVNDIEGNKKIADEIINDIKDLLILIKKYAKEQIIVVGYYNPLPTFTEYKEQIDEIIKYFDHQLELLCDDLEVDYVDVFDMFEGNTEYLPNPFDIHPSKKGYEQMANKIIKSIEELTK